MHDACLGASAIRDLDRISLPPPPAAAVIAFLFGPLAEHPKGVSRPLRHDLLGMHGARRGDYRVIYEIDDQESTVLVHRIDHRAHVCRPR